MEKTENGYDDVGRNILHLRRAGRMPWGWITDGTRWRHKPRTYSSMEDALQETARLYRRALWDGQSDHVELWTEKDALTGVVWPVVHQWDVPLMVSRGFTSETYLYEAAQQINGTDRPAYLYYLGDHDPSGVLIDKVIERKLRAFAPDAEIHFRRLAVTPEQIELYGLPTRPTKKGKNSHAKKFDGDSVEVDSIPPGTLRRIVRDAIESHIDRRQLEVCRVAERHEREALNQLALMKR